MTENVKSIPVTSLKSLGGRAPVFDLPVHLRPLDGEAFTLAFQAKALRKSEWAAARDASETKSAGGAKRSTYADIVAGGMQEAAELVLKCASGWGLEDEFNAGNLITLEDQCPGSFVAILTAYDRAIFQGRLGN